MHAGQSNWATTVKVPRTKRQKPVGRGGQMVERAGSAVAKDRGSNSRARQQMVGRRRVADDGPICVMVWEEMEGVWGASQGRCDARSPEWDAAREQGQAARRQASLERGRLTMEPETTIRSRKGPVVVRAVRRARSKAYASTFAAGRREVALQPGCLDGPCEEEPGPGGATSLRETLADLARCQTTKRSRGQMSRAAQSRLGIPVRLASGRAQRARGRRAGHGRSVGRTERKTLACHGPWAMGHGLWQNGGCRQRPGGGQSSHQGVTGEQVHWARFRRRLVSAILPSICTAARLERLRKPWTQARGAGANVPACDSCGHALVDARDRRLSNTTMPSPAVSPSLACQMPCPAHAATGQHCSSNVTCMLQHDHRCSPCFVTHARSSAHSIQHSKLG